eukprot:Awhi_evm1s279
MNIQVKVRAIEDELTQNSIYYDNNDVCIFNATDCSVGVPVEVVDCLKANPAYDAIDAIRSNTVNLIGINKLATLVSYEDECQDISSSLEYLRDTYDETADLYKNLEIISINLENGRIIEIIVCPSDLNEVTRQLCSGGTSKFIGLSFLPALDGNEASELNGFYEIPDVGEKIPCVQELSRVMDSPPIPDIRESAVYIPICDKGLTCPQDVAGELQTFLFEGSTKQNGNNASSFDFVIDAVFRPRIVNDCERKTKVLHLPINFHPEGLALGDDGDFYAGSIATGALWKGNLNTGAGVYLVTPMERLAGLNINGEISESTGLAYDPIGNILFVANFKSGSVSVFDGDNGSQLAFYDAKEIQLANDCIVAAELHAVYCTDSFSANLLEIPYTPGQLLSQPEDIKVINVNVSALTEDSFEDGDFHFNGIDTTKDGKRLLIVSSAEGSLLLVDPRNDLNDEQVAIDIVQLDQKLERADGIELQKESNTLYVVVSGRIAKVFLDKKYKSGIVNFIDNDLIDSPTTLFLHEKDDKGVSNSFLYTVNAKLEEKERIDLPYSVVGISL